MITVLILFALGIIAGYLLRKRKKFISLIDKLTSIAIYLLLLLLGIGVGANQEIISNLDSIGFKSLVIAITGIAGSIVVAWMVNKLFFSENER